MTTETSLEFVEKLEAFYGDNSESMSRLLRLAKTAALIENGLMWVEPPRGAARWRVIGDVPHHADDKDFHTAVRAVADRIKEGKC